MPPLSLTSYCCTSHHRPLHLLHGQHSCSNWRRVAKLCCHVFIKFLLVHHVCNQQWYWEHCKFCHRFQFDAVLLTKDFQANIITNQPDFSRWSKYRYASVWSQLFANPVSVTMSATFGILATSAINNVWGLQLWNPWDLLAAIMER